MKLRTGIYLSMMFGLAMLMTACGGGGGGGGGVAVTVIPVTAAKNPVLIGTPVTLTANFTNYTSTAKFGANKATVGATVNFTVSPAAAPGLSSQTAIQPDYTASVDLTAATAGKYTVTATLNTASGNATVSFIPQPGSARVVVVSPQALTNLGGITYNVTHDLPVVFRKYSSAAPNFIPEGSNPPASTLPLTLLPAVPVTPAFATGSIPGFNIAAGSSLVNLLYNMNIPANPGVPIFTVGNVQATLASPIVLIDPAPVLTLNPIYFSGANGTGTQLYP